MLWHRILLAIALVSLALPPAAVGLHSASNRITTTSVTRTFSTPLATPIWWDYSVIGGIPTGIQERTAMIEVNAPAPFVVEAFTIPNPATSAVNVNQCLPATVPETVLPVAVIHRTSCVVDNGYSVQVHYFPWRIDEDDPDHVVSPTLATPTAVLEWRVDAVPLSHKTAAIPAGHWQIWIDPAIAPPLPHSIQYKVTSNSPFYFDALGFRGCPFYAEVTDGVSDEALLGCPIGYI